MYPRAHTPILPQNNIICIELYGPRSLQDMNPLHLGLHNMFVLLFKRVQATCGNKIKMVTYMKFCIKGLRRIKLY